MNEKEILKKCVENLYNFQPVESVSIIKEPKILREKGIDAKIQVTFKAGVCRYSVEIKSLLKRPLSAYLFNLSRAEGDSLLVMSGYINPSIAMDLKQAEIQYIDTAGNAFLRLGRMIHIEVKGKKSEYMIQPATASLFQPKLMQMLAIFLIDPKSVNQTVRELATRAGLSKDRVSVGLRLLKEKGWLIRSGKGQYRLSEKRKLFDQWLMNYGERLRPKMIIGTYKVAPSSENRIEAMFTEVFRGKEKSYAFTGTFGAERLVHYFRGKTTEIFVTDDIIETIREKLKLIPSKEPNVTLFNLFSPVIIFEHKEISVAHPLLIYAELLYQGGDRELETAKIIYDRYLRGLVE